MPISGTEINNYRKSDRGRQRGIRARGRMYEGELKRVQTNEGSDGLRIRNIEPGTTQLFKTLNHEMPRVDKRV